MSLRTTASSVCALTDDTGSRGRRAPPSSTPKVPIEYLDPRTARLHIFDDLPTTSRDTSPPSAEYGEATSLSRAASPALTGLSDDMPWGTKIAATWDTPTASGSSNMSGFARGPRRPSRYEQLIDPSSSFSAPRSTSVERRQTTDPKKRWGVTSSFFREGEGSRSPSLRGSGHRGSMPRARSADGGSEGGSTGSRYSLSLWDPNAMFKQSSNGQGKPSRRAGEENYGSFGEPARRELSEQGVPKNR